MAEEGKRLEPPSMVLMEDPADGSVGGVGGYGQDGVAAGVYKESGLEECGLGDGILHLVDGGDHLRSDGEVLLGLRQGVRQGAADMCEAGKERP